MSASGMTAGAEMTASVDLGTLDVVQRRVLWLATAIVHHANKVRKTQSGVKVGGHQASSASIVSIMTALYFAHLRGPDRVSVKPHASPVLHAINYLLGRLDASYLTELRVVRRVAVVSRHGPRTPIRSTSPPAASASEPRRRCGARLPIATWPDISTYPRAAARLRCWVTRNSTRARSGRLWSIGWCRDWARCCGSSI